MTTPPSQPRRNEAQILRQYLDNPRVPIEMREDYEAELSKTKTYQWLARGCMALTLVGGLAAHFDDAYKIGNLEKSLLDAPEEIHDLGERYWRNPGHGMTVEQAALANAARSIIAQENPWRSKAVIRIPPTGNTVYALHAYEENVRVNPASLAVIYRKNLQDEIVQKNASQEKGHDFAIIFNCLALIWVLKAGQARRETVDIAFKHYGIK